MIATNSPSFTVKLTPPGGLGIRYHGGGMFYVAFFVFDHNTVPAASLNAGTFASSCSTFGAEGFVAG